MQDCQLLVHVEFVNNYYMLNEVYSVTIIGHGTCTAVGACAVYKYTCRPLSYVYIEVGIWKFKAKHFILYFPLTFLLISKNEE